VAVAAGVTPGAGQSVHEGDRDGRDALAATG